MKLTPAQAQTARRFLSAAIEKNTVLTNAACRAHGNVPAKYPPNIVFENQRRTDENDSLQVLLANLPALTQA